MKRARPPLALHDSEAAGALLTTGDIARLLRVHPKHVYRLLRRGLPGRRVGGEWRFLADEVRRWSGARMNPPTTGAGALAERQTADPFASPALPPALVAANGDIAVERLLGRLAAAGGPPFGHVQADRGIGLELLKRGVVLAAGSHGDEIPGAIDDERLAFIRLVDRQVGLAVRPGVRLGSLRHIGRWRLASRPPTAGVRHHLDRELRRQGIDPDLIHARATLLSSHGDVVCAVARGEADVGLASAAWATRVGLDCIPLCRETYGLVVRARLLGDPRIVRLCEVAQSPGLRKELQGVNGYQARRSGAISYEAIAVRAGS